MTTLDYGIISALVQQLPAEKQWTKAQRDKWFLAAVAVVDLIIEVVEPEVI